MQFKWRVALLITGLTPCLLVAQSKEKVTAGHDLFLQKCAFCHGRDASGGETGPDLTASQLVKSDVDGDKIGYVIRNGRPEKGMPKFQLPDDDVASLVAFIHNQVKLAASKAGGRKGVSAADLQTGSAQAGQQYFDGPGGCSGCHSPSGDLAHVASKYPALKLELHMLYPENPKQQVTVKLPSGETLTGTVAYLDEFTLGMRDATGTYRSWPTTAITFKVDDPADAHWKLLSKYSDEDIHNLFAYVQTLR